MIIEKSGTYLTTARIQGHSFMSGCNSEKELQAAILAALEPLQTLHARRTPLKPQDDDYLRMLAKFVRGHKYRSDLVPALAVLEHWNGNGLGSVAVHGDYWLNNILGSDNRVTGIVDWDRARLHGSPAFDALHLGFMSYAMWADIYVSDLLASLWTEEWQYPWLAHYTKVIAEVFAVTLSDVHAIAAMLWLSYFYHRVDDAPREDWHRHMIEPVCRALSSVGMTNPILHVP